MQGHVPALIDGNVPARFHLLQQHHLQSLAAAARATQADNPIFIAVTSQNEIPARQLRRQHVALDDFERTPRRERRQYPPPPKRLPFHATLRCCASAGNPSSGSLTPKATGNRSVVVN